MHMSSDAIMTELRWSNFVAPKGSRWKHKKGGLYEVIGHLFSTARNTTEVVYVRLAGPNYYPDLDPQIPFSRPTNEWTKDRFQRI